MRWLLLLAFATAIAAAGCNREDADKLARVGWRITEKVRGLVPQHSPIVEPWDAAASSEGRIRMRIELDKFLVTLGLEVVAIPDGVCIRGSVGDEALKQRALDLATSTVGVDKVVDEIAVNP